MADKVIVGIDDLTALADAARDNLGETQLYSLNELTDAVSRASALPQDGIEGQVVVMGPDGKPVWDIMPQGDWAENDETSSAYIKNRTHYEGWGTSVIMPETAPDYIGNEDGMMMAMYAKPLAAGLEVGKEYTVNYNGVAYKCVAIDGTTIDSLGRVLGDVGLMTGGESTGEPFVFMCLNEAEAADMNMGIMGILLDGAETLNLSITYEGIVIHKLDSKYLDITTPDWNATSKDKGYIANRTHYTDDKGIYEVDTNNVEGLESFVMPNGATAYKVYDGTLYHNEIEQARLTWFRDGASNTPFIDYTYYSSYVLGEGSNGFGGLIQISSADEAETELGVENIPSEGIYLYNNSSEYNILRLFLNNIVYKLDKKYLDLSDYYNKSTIDYKLKEITPNPYTVIGEYTMTGLNKQTISLINYKDVVALVNSPHGGSGEDGIKFTIQTSNYAYIAYGIEIAGAIMPHNDITTEIGASIINSYLPYVYYKEPTPNNNMIYTQRYEYTPYLTDGASTLKLLTINIETISGNNFTDGTKIKVYGVKR